MGSWRKVGAFLGLVPDEGRRDEFGDEYQDADGYRDDYARPTGMRPITRPAQYRGDDFDRGHDAPIRHLARSPADTGRSTMTHGALAVQPGPIAPRTGVGRRHPARHGQTDRVQRGPGDR